MAMNPRYLQRFGEPPPFRDSIARAALREDPDAPYGELATGESDGQRLFDPPDFQPSMNKGSLVATPSTAQMAADMTPNVYRPENGEPYTNTGAPWHQGQLPAVPHGDLLVSSSPLDERTNPIPGGAGYNYASEMASSAPMSQPLVTAPPSAPMENPIVRNQRERAELEAAGGGPAKPESRWPVNDFVTARKPFQPPPTIESNALKSIVPPPDAPEIDSGRLPPPPVIDTRELPTAPPPESTIAKLIRQRLENKEPERGPVSKWAKLAAVALGAGQGYYNAANPNARPIDASEAVQNLTLGRKYIDAMGKYQRTNKNLDEQIKLVGEAEDIESRIADRLDKAKTREDTNKDRDDTRIANNFRISVEFAKSGSVVVPRGSPLTPGAVRIDANPLDPTGKTVVDVMPTGKQRIITDKRVATALGRNLNDLVSDAEYIQGAKEVWEYDKAIRLKELEVAAKPDSTLTHDYKNYLLSQKDGFKGTFEQWMDRDANRRKTQLSIGGDDSTRLTPGESAALGVPYGTTRAQAEGKLASTEGQKKEAIYASRMTRANKVIKDIEGDISGQGTIGQAIQGAVPNWMKSENTQVFEQAKRDFMNANLRQESGAVIGPSEFANANTQYFPQPGDGANVLEQKRINRALALDGLVKASGNAYERPQENKPAPNAGPGRGGGGNVPARPAGVPKNAVFDPVIKEWVEP